MSGRETGASVRKAIVLLLVSLIVLAVTAAVAEAGEPPAPLRPVLLHADVRVALWLE